MSELRPYQKMASDAAFQAFRKGVWNGLVILPQGAGKSHVIADVASRLDSPLLVLCPTREIVLQDHEKIRGAGMFDVGIYSASIGDKNIRKITIATIGSVYNRMEDFRLFRYVIVDEAHNVAPDGMYYSFIYDRTDRVVVGLTATPYRYNANQYGCCLTFLTRTTGRIFDKVLHVTQVGSLVRDGFLVAPRYFDLSAMCAVDLSRVRLTASRQDYEEESLREELVRCGYQRNLLSCVMNVMRQRECNGILVFTRFVSDAEDLVRRFGAYGVKAAAVSGDTPRRDRNKVLEGFKNGRIKVVANASVLVEGFNYPALDTIVLAHPTRSLRRYCQEVGRVMRPYKDKEAWVVDLVGTSTMFGRVEDMVVSNDGEGNMWKVVSKGRPLTGIDSILSEY